VTIWGQRAQLASQMEGKKVDGKNKRMGDENIGNKKRKKTTSWGMLINNNLFLLPSIFNELKTI